LRSYKKSFRRLEDIDINGSIDITQWKLYKLI
jgi:hypothetical protein